MKYESNILKRLIDTYGVIGNPRYLSEIIKEFIVRGKELYPQLFTYQSDWLAHIDEYGLTPDYVVSYTGQQIYAPHTKERPVKRAILKGSTKYRDIDTGEVLDAFEDGRNLELVSVKMPVLKTVSGFNLLNPNAEPIPYEGNDVLHPDYFKAKFGDSFSITTKDSGALWCSLFCYDSDKNLIKPYYQNDAPLPRTITLNDDSLRDVAYVRFECAKWGRFDNIMLNYGEQMPFAEYSGEYKSNILTVNEDVILRGIGDVKDTLDCLTGEVTERIGEIVLDGSETWREWSTTETSYGFALWNTLKDFKPRTVPICNALLSYNFNDFSSKDKGVALYTTNTSSYSIFIRLPKTECTGLEDFKTKLQTNPITVQYELATESIKTVGLSILDQNENKVSQLSSFNGGTHFTTSSQDGSLLPTLSVDVVTNLEETLMVCSLEGNTM